MAMKLYVIGAVTAAGLFAAATSAQAQAPAPATEKIFVNVNFGLQLADRTVNSSASIPLYDETATITATQPVGGGAVVDFGGGYRIWNDIYAGVVITRFSNTHSASYTTSVPHPIFFDQPKTATGIVDDLRRSEIGINPHVLWVTPLTDKIDLSVGVGVSIISVTQDLITDLSVAPGTQDATPIVVEESKSGTGIYAAVDVAYSVTPRYGFGGFVRYAGATVDLSASPEANVGGMQVGGGVRLRF